MSAVRFFNLSEPVVPLFRDLGQAILAEGRDVEFVISRSSYRGGDSGLATAVPDATVVATIGPRRQFRSRLGRALAMVLYWVGASWVILTGPKPVVNVFLTQPPCFVGLGARLARLRRQPYVIVVMDLHPDELVAFGVLKERSRVTEIFGAMMCSALSNAEKVVVIGRCMGARIRSKGTPPDRVTVVPNWVDDTLIEPVDRAVNRVRKDLGWGDEFVVMYGGNVGHAQEFSTFVEVADRIRPEEGITLAVVGDGSRAEEVRSGMDATAAGEYHPLLHERHSLGEVLSAADVHFISLRKECTGLGVPSKLYAAMASGRPVIFEGSEESEVFRSVGEHDIGTGVPLNDADLLLDEIRRLAADPAAWGAMCKRSRATLEARYTSRHGVDRYLEVLRPWLHSRT